jgi:hypothetical protein
MMFFMLVQLGANTWNFDTFSKPRVEDVFVTIFCGSRYNAMMSSKGVEH